MQMFANLAKDRGIHGREAVDKVVAYVRGTDDEGGE
jgi:hypothetical protein